jgi:hypothetical protein
MNPSQENYQKKNLIHKNIGIHYSINYSNIFHQKS